MQAVVVAEFGGPEVLVAAEVPDPVAGPGEAVVAVAAAHVLWVETRIRSGVGREYWGVTPPYVPGSGVAGRVAERRARTSIRPCSGPGSWRTPAGPATGTPSASSSAPTAWSRSPTRCRTSRRRRWCTTA